MNKSVIIIFIGVLFFLFSSCSNGLHISPALGTDNDDSGINDEDAVIVPPPPLDGTGALGTGSNTFSFALTLLTDPLPENYSHVPLEGIYTSISDMDGKGFTVDYILTVDVPKYEDLLPPNEDENTAGEGSSESVDEIETSVESETTNAANPYKDGDQNIRVMISDFIEVEGTKDYLSATFVNGDDHGQTFTFTPEKNEATLRFVYSESKTTRRGTLPILFEYKTEVYSSLMPLRMVVYSYSKGTFEPETITLTSFTETDNSVDIFEMPSSGTTKNYNIALQNKDKVTAESNNYAIELAMNFLGVLEEAPLKVTAKDASGMSLDSSTIVPDYTSGTAKISLKLTHSGIDYFDKTNGAITIVIDDTISQEIYKDFPMTIVLNTEREESFKHYAQEYVNKFNTSHYSQNLNDENGYYTQISLPAFDPASDATLSYKVHRKDLSSDSWKVASEGSFNANTGLQNVRDYNALKLDSSDPWYKLEITHVETARTSGEKTGSRKLTGREVALAVMNSIRYGLIDKGLHPMGSGGNFTASPVEEKIYSDTFIHRRTYDGWPMSYTHTYTLNNYRPYEFSMTGSFGYTSDNNNRGTGTIINAIDTVNAKGVKDKAPFTGTVNFNSPYGNGSMTFNSININDDTWNSPGWTDGTLSVTVDGRQTSYDNSSMKFLLYMNWDHFKAFVAPGGVYTQQ